MRQLFLLCVWVMCVGQVTRANDFGLLIKESLVATVKASSESLIEQNFQNIFSELPVTLNTAVKTEILELLKMKNYLNKVFGRGAHFFPEIELAMIYNDVPQELKFITIIESGLNHMINSPYGNVGFWQFSAESARSSGLIVNEHVDERLDPKRSSEAAAKYLKKLYDKYQDWWLAVAAYNCGSKRVDTALKGGSDYDYWDIRKSLPAVTQEYIPKLIALIYLDQFQFDHEIEPESFYLDMKYSQETFIQGQFQLSTVCADYFVSEEKLKKVNPFLKSDNFDTGAQGLMIRIPGEPTPVVVHNPEPAIVEEPKSRILEIVPPLVGYIKVKKVLATR